MARYINVCLMFFAMGILFVGLSNLVHAEDKCGVIAEKLVKPDAAVRNSVFLRPDSKV